jgi:hypothetical protein
MLPTSYAPLVALLCSSWPGSDGFQARCLAFAVVPCQQDCCRSWLPSSSWPVLCRSGVSVPCLFLYLAQLLAVVLVPCSWCPGVGGDCNKLRYYIIIMHNTATLHDVVLQCCPLPPCVHACCSSSQTCACLSSSDTVPAATSVCTCTLLSRWCVLSLLLCRASCCSVCSHALHGRHPHPSFHLWPMQYGCCSPVCGLPCLMSLTGPFHPVAVCLAGHVTLLAHALLAMLPACCRHLFVLSLCLCMRL